MPRMAAGSHYSDQQRREAVGHYVMLGNWRRVSEATGIPQRTLSHWATQSWFGTLLAEVRQEKSAELDGAYTRILHLATDQLMDRLTNGDPVVINGQLARKPVAARDLALVAAITFDKRTLARSQEPPKRALDHSLQDLAEFLEAKARAKCARAREQSQSPD